MIDANLTGRVLFAEFFNPRLVFARIRPALGDGTSSLIGLHSLTVLLRFASNLILTRLVAPEAFGAIAIITSIMYVLNMIMDIGLKAFVTRHETADDELLQTVWTVRVLRNLILGGAMFLGADALAELYANPDIADAIRVSAALFLFGAFGTLAFATGQRERRVLRISYIEFAQFLISTGITLVAAYFLRNYWAIIIGMFVGAVFSMAASYFLIPYRPLRFRLDREHLLDLWRFSKYVIPSGFITIILSQTDKFLIANLFPLAELGKYMLAVMIGQAINSLTDRYVTRVFFPLVAQLHREDPDRVGAAFYDSRRRLTLLLAFGIGGIIGGGQLVVQILFNDLYLGAGFYLSLVAGGCLARLLVQPGLSALVAKGFVRATLFANLLRIVWLAISAPAAYFVWGPIGIVVAVVLTEVAVIPYLWWRQSRNDIFDFFQEALVLAAAAVGALIGYLAYQAAQTLIGLGYLPNF